MSRAIFWCSLLLAGGGLGFWGGTKLLERLEPRPASPALTGEEREAVRELIAAPAQREPAPVEVDMPPTPDPRSEVGPSPELVELRARVRDLEAELASPDALRYRLRQAEIRAALEPDGQVGFWAQAVGPGGAPDEHTQLCMASLLHDYPVELQPDEGLWLAERVQADDWPSWGPSVDEAIVAFFGAERIAQARAEQEADER